MRSLRRLSAFVHALKSRRYGRPSLVLLSAMLAFTTVWPGQALGAGPTDSRALYVPPAHPATAPAPDGALQPMIRWAYMVGDRIPDALSQHPDEIDFLSPAWFHLDVNGNIYGHDSPAVTRFAKDHGIKVVPIVANGEFQPSVADALVTDGNRQTRMLDSLQWLVNNFGYDGVNIDFENVPGKDRPGLSAMMSNVYARLHPLGKLVTIALPSKTHDTNSGFSGGFDYAGIAPNVDLALLMAYDQHYSSGAPGPVADIAWVSDVINYAKTVIPANKLLLGLPLYGYNWNLSSGGARAMRYSDIVAKVLGTGAHIDMVQAAQSPTFLYDGGDGIHRVWFENSTSLAGKIDLANNKGLAGWGVWRLGQEDPNFWTLPLGRRTVPMPDPLTTFVAGTLRTK